jgi:hypothetical protein
LGDGIDLINAEATQGERDTALITERAKQTRGSFAGSR